LTRGAGEEDVWVFGDRAGRNATAQVGSEDRAFEVLPMYVEGYWVDVKRA
jgi:hypothetical protein